MGTFRTITACIGVSLILFCLGCGVVAIPIGGTASPSISQVYPQTITAGTQGTTLKVMGSNFDSAAVIQWNGNALPTSVVDANTLAASVQSSDLASPSVVALTVHNKQTGQSSNSVPVTVAPGNSGNHGHALAISTTSLPSGTAGAAYSAGLAATGGSPAYTWSITSGQLPGGMTLDAASGVISGTPTASGTYNFMAKVTDSSSSAQTASAALTLTVVAGAQAIAPLQITSPSLPASTEGTAYSAGLAATGGTLSYTWTITSGRLPLGLSLGSANGAISGTPTVSGTFSFTATVTDSSSPARTVSVPLTMTIAAASPAQAGSPSLTITTATLPSGTDGVAYATALQASGGTPAYTWSITAGSLPSGLTMSATTGAISGTPSASGTFNFTVAVADNSNPAQKQSLATSISVTAAPVAPTGPGATWYVRPDGGTRYSSNMTSGQCDGKGDAAYPGTGTNQHCAFNDVRFLWQDGSYTTGTTFPSWGWVIAGGDTVIIRGSISTGVSYRVGWNNLSTYCDSTTNLCFGITGNPSGSGAPPPPSGTALQHTRILGENYAACSNQSARAQIHGGWGLWDVLDMSGASYVELGCLDITDFSNCGRDLDTVPCDSTQDFAHDGLVLANTSTHDTLTDVRIHGMASDGIVGPTGDGFVATDLAIVGNADAGWNADRGDGTTGVGSLFVQNFNISWNGCVEEYPMVDPEPYFSCTDQSSGGYGDGFGTATVPSPAPGWQVHFDQGVVYYNTQDGLDALHVSGPGSTMTVTRVLAYGNEGQQLKVGNGATATIQNSVIVGNCEAMSTQAIPGAPAGFGSKLGNACRAGNTAVLINVTPGDPAVFQGNTMYAAGSVGLEVEYATSDTGPTNTLQFNDNIFVGFYNASAQANTTPIYSSTNLNMLTNPGASWSNNTTIGQRGNWACPAPGENHALCTDPGLVDETYHPFGFGNMKPASSSSAVVGAGIAVPALSTDYNGVARPNPPSMGALEP